MSLALAIRIVEYYRAAGIPADLWEGYVLVKRADGWCGPFDPEALEGIYRDECEGDQAPVRLKIFRSRT